MCVDDVPSVTPGVVEDQSAGTSNPITSSGLLNAETIPSAHTKTMINAQKNLAAFIPIPFSAGLRIPTEPPRPYFKDESLSSPMSARYWWS